MAKYETTADGSRAFVPIGELQALEADAQRYRGIRLLLCEQDEAMQARMFEALEKYGDTVRELDTEPKGIAPERLDAIIDGAIIAAAEARQCQS